MALVSFLLNYRKFIRGFIRLPSPFPDARGDLQPPGIPAANLFTGKHLKLGSIRMVSFNNLSRPHRVSDYVHVAAPG
jgi:hypothetical protein